MDKAPTSLGGVATVWQGGVVERSAHVEREEEIKTRRGVVDGARQRALLQKKPNGRLKVLSVRRGHRLIMPYATPVSIILLLSVQKVKHKRGFYWAFSREMVMFSPFTLTISSWA